jgi:Flp pilus assembly protein TadG
MRHTTRRGLAVRRIDVRRDEGVAMAEFALIAPVFLLLVVGILTFGRVFYYWIGANHTANETARWAVVDFNPYKTCTGTATGQPGCETLQQHAITGVGTDEFENGAEACISFPGTVQEVGSPLKVQVKKPFYVLPFLGIGNITIRGTATMRIENLRTVRSYDVGQNIGSCT